MTNAMKLTIEREGEFPVGWTHSHDHQCGNKGTQIMHFRAKIEGLATDCNKQGWMIDNNDIPGYFAKTYKHVKDFQPCEKIAEKACREFREVVAKSGARCRCVTVAVSGIPGSWITAQWKEEGWL